MASSIAALQTHDFALLIGRIAAGIQPTLNIASEVSPAVTAALIESTICLFFSGVQVCFLVY